MGTNQYTSPFATLHRVRQASFRMSTDIVTHMFEDSTKFGNPGEIMLSGAAGQSQPHSSLKKRPNLGLVRTRVGRRPRVQTPPRSFRVYLQFPDLASMNGSV